jgi:hypothetical protein
MTMFSLQKYKQVGTKMLLNVITDNVISWILFLRLQELDSQPNLT